MTFWFEKSDVKFGIQLKMSHMKTKISLVIVDGVNVVSQGL